MQSSMEQQNAMNSEQSLVRPNSSAAQSGLETSVPVSPGINSDQAATATAPQVHVHMSEDQSDGLPWTDGPTNATSHALGSARSHASNALRPGSSASSPTSQYATSSQHHTSAGSGLSPHNTPPVIANNPSLISPAPLPHGFAGHSGHLGGLGRPHEGRISPRPVSRNHSRASNHHDMSHNGDGYGRAPGDNRIQLFVGNLPFRVRWQDLKDLFRKCGAVLRSDVALTLDNRSKGFGTVLYANEEDARNAIETFNGYTWQSRVLDVRVDQQDPTGSISLANAAAQQAQHHAYQTHQQAMQNMANMVGATQGAAAAAMYQQAQGYPMFNQGPGSSTWMAAAMANNFRPNLHGPNGFQQHAQPSMHQQGGQAQYMMPGRAASPYRAVQLGNDLANMSLRRNSSSTEGSSRPSLPQSGSSSSLGLPPGRGDGGAQKQSTSAGTASLPGTSPVSPILYGTSINKAASPSPIAGTAEHRDSVSPTSARRAPPGSLGPMPPSIFAGMPQNAQLPNPPAAAAAAVAAGYSLDNEDGGGPRHGTPSYPSSSNRDMGSGSRRGSGTLQEPAAHPGQHLRQQQIANLESDASFSPQPGPAAAPLPGGLVNFYQQHRAPANYLQNPASYGASTGGRNSPAPAFADRQLFVGNIPFNCQWQDLKDLFRAAGSIMRADVSLGPDGRSRGFGRVVYATPEDAINAMQMFNGYEFQGRPLKVHFDKFAPGGTPLNQMPATNPYQAAVNHVHESQFIQSSGIGGSQNGQVATRGTHFNGNGYNYAGQGDWQHNNGNHGISYDDNSSVPGTPIHEMSLAQMAAFPSPGFGSPIQHQFSSAQSADQRRRGFNADGVPVAPIGSGAPHAQHEGRPHMQHGHAMPLSPLMIPPMSMATPSPGPGGLFSPPLPGMGPMMTPSIGSSVPGFSFHPFPQTPPLLPHFLSPGLGPFSPPLFGTPGAFVGYNGPSGLRNSAPGGTDSTPLQSPNAIHATHQQGNYFPPLPDQPQASTRNTAKTATVYSDNNYTADEAEVKGSSEDAEITSADQGSLTPTLAQSEVQPPTPSKLAAVEAESSPEAETSIPTGRRSSFREQKTFLLDVPPTSNNRGGSLDIPRPDMKLGEIASLAGGGSALDDGEDTPPASDPAAPTNESTSQAAQTKKSAWNLSWLKKQ